MPTSERTLVLVKPDGVQRLLIGRILARYEERGLKVVGLKLVQTSRELAERHYAAHSERPFFGSLVDFITSSPLVALALEGPNAIAVVRAINGATKPHEAAPGTIRGDFALETAQNIVHASDGPEAAAVELGLWFTSDELLAYDRSVDTWVLPPAD
jgi:nucleoside-diphosphate kinase